MDFLKRLLGRDRCAWCSVKLAPTEDSFTTGFSTYCTARHAKLAQTFNF